MEPWNFKFKLNDAPTGSQQTFYGGKTYVAHRISHLEWGEVSIKHARPLLVPWQLQIWKDWCRGSCGPSLTPRRHTTPRSCVPLCVCLLTCNSFVCAAITSAHRNFFPAGFASFAEFCLAGRDYLAGGWHMDGWALKRFNFLPRIHQKVKWFFCQPHLQMNHWRVLELQMLFESLLHPIRSQSWGQGCVSFLTSSKHINALGGPAFLFKHVTTIPSFLQQCCCKRTPPSAPRWLKSWSCRSSPAVRVILL